MTEATTAKQIRLTRRTPEYWRVTFDLPLLNIFGPETRLVGGEQFADEKLEAYPPGAVVVLPGGTAHFHWAKSGEYVTQVTGIGPLGLEYVDSQDDPRNV